LNQFGSACDVIISLMFNAVPTLMLHHSEPIRHLCPESGPMIHIAQSMPKTTQLLPIVAHVSSFHSALQLLANLGNDLLYPGLLDLLLSMLDGIANLEDVPTSLAEVGSEA
jgi:hypothetical protein